MRTLAALVRALLGLAVLAAVIAATPVLLLTFGVMELPGGLDVLTQPDDGRLFLTALTGIGWVAWAAFAAATLIETIALARRRAAPRIKGLGSMQRFASALIGGIVLLAPTAASAATAPTVAAATAAPGPHSPAAPAAQSDDQAGRDKDDANWPRHTVSSATESPAGLAEKYLGDWQRWKDIAALNPGIPELTTGDSYVPKGTVLKLPADARLEPPTDPAPAPSASNTADETGRAATTEAAETSQTGRSTPRADRADDTDRPARVTVQDDGNLWDIADRYGDPTDWPAIFEENKGELQPGGTRFTDPNLIVPGQKLDLPPSDPADEAPATPDHNDPPAPDTSKDKPGEKPAPDKTPDKDTEAGKPTPPATPAPSADTATPSRTAPPAAQPASDSDAALAPVAVWAGAGALAAALVTTLATRRMLQQRRRRPGRRIPMPVGRAAATEQGLRAAQRPSGFDLLSTALRSLALNLAAADRDLPVLEAVVLHEAKVELHLAADTTPMKPFTAAAGREDVWVCSVSSPSLADVQQLQDAEAPYPALVSIGWDGAGHLVLVDLEHVGILNLAGDSDFARHVLQAIAVELTSTPLPGHLEVTALAGTAPGLDAAAPARVVRIDDLATATAELTSHTDDQRRTLAAIGADSLRTARLMDDAGGAWTPHILLAEALPDSSERSELFATLTDEPRAAGAVITAEPSAELPDLAWTLDCQGPDHTIALPGSNLPVKLQGLSDDHYADAVELLTLAASDTDVPAPDWTRSDPDGPHDEGQDDDAEHEHQEPDYGTGPVPTAAADEDGLPAEYADLELTTTAEPDEPQPRSQADNAAPSTAEPYPDEEGEQGQEEKLPTGPTLAEVLDIGFLHDDPAEPKQNAQPGSTNDEADAPAPDPTGSMAAPTSPCAPPEATAVHITLPAPAPATGTHADQATIPAPAAAHAPDTTPPQPAAEPAEDAPSVLLLGPIGIDGATGRIDSSRRSVGIELTAFLALNPGVDHHAIDEALWPGRLVGKEMRNAVISRTRSWLGKDPDGKAHLPRVQDTGDSRYRLGPTVTCDWTRFQRLARAGLARHDEDGDLMLRRALALVRGRPFTGIDPQRYAWAEPAIQEMVSAIVDVAYELSSRRREAGDIPAALWAAHRGMLAAEESEILHRQVFLAHHAADDLDALRDAAARLARINEQLLGGADMEAETAELLRNLLPRPVHPASANLHD
ncbi:hypothetical protein STRAU_1583 [Streptomyces aurantiacus JA 4570]|uniref:LysM domain-containing protein n=1 Tax=Streptomyces aurantiacus JA 4570 TaxID=1286094 RepID=S3ZQ26_9ACTN|nr:hypothetical protein STRAU_1583 [Streptomyces aurantiacus JA 4570]